MTSTSSYLIPTVRYHEQLTGLNVTVLANLWHRIASIITGFHNRNKDASYENCPLFKYLTDASFANYIRRQKLFYIIQQSEMLVFYNPV